MPLIKASLVPNSRLEVVTTTLFDTLPTTGAVGNSRSSVPVPVIAGGVVAGAVLAITATLIWICWGKTIKRSRQQQQREMEKHRRTTYNTIRNSRISTPKNHSYRPILKRPQDDEKRVKFVGEEKAPAHMAPGSENIDPERAKHMLFDNPNTPPPRPAWTIEQRLRRTGSVIWPIPRNPLKKLSQNSIKGNSREVAASPTGHGQGSREAERSIPHKPSNVSATSQHSNASGESRQGRVPTNLILAALGNAGNKNTLHAGDRQSTSSLWSYLFRAMPGARNSQHSADNAYQPPEDQAGYPVGTAV